MRPLNFVLEHLVGIDTVGVELPNRDRQNVRFREVMEERIEDVDSMTLPIFLGKESVHPPDSPEHADGLGPRDGHDRQHCRRQGQHRRVTLAFRLLHGSCHRCR